ncbi:hypothetical protein ACFIQF_11620 [Comamonas sp. J-3]|uniref:hypothetical protein n=1 Tax=Comamonas trifloxystrobinivorans TaxID=3350256 RepID=UPI00372BE853
MSLITLSLFALLAIALLAWLVAWPLLVGYWAGQATSAFTRMASDPARNAQDEAERAMRAELIASTRKAAGLPPLQ